MIHLTTGLPGNGKTLYTISQVKERAEREQRPVFYAGIPDLSLPWTELQDPRKWHECPAGSIIVLDECQGVLPTRPQGSQPPEYVAKFSVHRHSGFDVYLITQDPMQFDHFVRRLVGVWWHLVRPFGLSYSQLWEFQRVGAFDDKDFRKEGQKRRWDFPADLFGVYRSAEVHTHKRRLPLRRFAMLAGLVGLVVGAGWFGWRTLHGMWQEEPASAKVAPKSGVAATGSPFGALVSGASSRSQPATSGEYLRARWPRLADVPESAPVYDELAKPVSFPRVSACVKSARGCTCYSQQGTVLGATSASFCEGFVKAGAFNPYLSDPLVGAASAKQQEAPHGAVSAGGGVSGDAAPAPPGAAPSRPADPATLRVLLEPVAPAAKGGELKPTS